MLTTRERMGYRAEICNITNELRKRDLYSFDKVKEMTERKFFLENRLTDDDLEKLKCREKNEMTKEPLIKNYFVNNSDYGLTNVEKQNKSKSIELLCEPIEETPPQRLTKPLHGGNLFG